MKTLVDEDLPDDAGRSPELGMANDFKKRVILEEKGTNPRGFLPVEWVLCHHISGLPFFMHRTTRVCTLSKPYYFDGENIKSSEIPESAIPCYAYRRAFDEEKKRKETANRVTEQVRTSRWDNKPQETSKTDQCGSEVTGDNTESNYGGISIKKEVLKDEEEIFPFLHGEVGGRAEEMVEESIVEGNEISGVDAGESAVDMREKLNYFPEATASLSGVPDVLPGGTVMGPITRASRWTRQRLSPKDFNKYCRRLFKFKTINTTRLECLSDLERKTQHGPTMPGYKKRITNPVRPSFLGEEYFEGRVKDRKWVLAMKGCSYLAIFNEYIRRANLEMPVYHFKLFDSAAWQLPHQATAHVCGRQLGVGRGYRMCQAKYEAARHSVHMLMPDVKAVLEAHAPVIAPY